MDFALTPEQETLRRSARQFLSLHSSSQKVREAMQSPHGYDREVWRLIAQDLGWPAILIPEEFGGAGGTHVDLGVVMEEAGRFLLCAPLFSTVALATNALLLFGTEAHKRTWLPRFVDGSATGTVAVIGHVQARTTNGGFDLAGEADFVTDGASADLIIFTALTDRGERGLFLVPGDAPGLSRVPHTTIDRARHQALLKLNNVFVPEADRVSGDVGSVATRALAALACEQVGAAERCLDMAVDYAKTRVQFNRPIGSFQAIKHKCADLALLVESSRSAAYHAAWTIDEAPGESEDACRAAKVYCSEACFHCASENVQIHGGIGFTQEHDAQLYFKRAQSSEVLLGSPRDHRGRLAGRLLAS